MLGYTDAGVVSGTTYFYVVTAVNSLGESGQSSEAFETAWSGAGSASTENPPNETAARAFDGLTSTKWFNANGGNTGWLRYYFGGPARTVIRYDLASANDVPGRDPKNWQFQGSQNGTAWTTLDTRTGEAFPSRFQAKQYSFGNSTAYAYYRLNVTANNGDASGIQLAEMSFVSLPAVSTTPPRLNVAKTNGLIRLSWPPDHIGWRLETSPVLAGPGTSWTTWSGSAQTNLVVVPGNTLTYNAFFRLAYP